MIHTSHFLAEVALSSTQEIFDVLVETSGIKIERIVSTGQQTPAGEWYDQDWDEWVMVIKGHGRLRIDGQDELIEMRDGDFIQLPAHCRHRVEWTDPDQPTVWLAIHFPT